MAVAMLLRLYLRERFFCDGDDENGDASDGDGKSVDDGDEDDEDETFFRPNLDCCNIDLSKFFEICKTPRLFR